MSPIDYLTLILKSRVYEACDETDLKKISALSERIDNQVYLKREDEQQVFSFKGRGAYNKIANLDQSAQQKGVIAASAGNHAQGVAHSASLLGIKATIVMPMPTPDIKVNAVKKWGARVVLVGDNFDEAQAYSLELAEEENLTVIHAFDDDLVIAGQGTIGMELLKQLPPHKVHAIFVPCGGGGLLAGIASYVKAIAPHIKIICVEPEDAASMKASIEANEHVSLNEVGIFAEGVAVKRVGTRTFEVARQCVDEFITVTTDESCAAIKDIYQDTRSIVEPAGAVATAGLKKYVASNNISGKNLIAIASGANVNFDRLRHIAERAEIGEEREAILAITIPEQRGSFEKFVKVIGKRSITEFNYRLSNPEYAQIFVGVSISNADDTQMVINEITKAGFPCLDLSNNEMAKLHLRHMVSGGTSVSDERLIRFEFPERPGALRSFLKTIGGRWNISLFHYRNHGAAFGRILTGIQVPNGDEEDFQQFLDQLNYQYTDETANPAYQLFMGAMS